MSKTCPSKFVKNEDPNLSIISLFMPVSLATYLKHKRYLDFLDYVADCPRGGITPSCCNMPTWSIRSQVSTNLPPRMRLITSPIAVTCFPVGGMPIISPLCVPRPI